MAIRIFSADAGTILFRLPHRIADVLGLLFDGIRRSGYFFFYGMFYVRRMLLDAVGYIRNLFGTGAEQTAGGCPSDGSDPEISKNRAIFDPCGKSEMFRRSFYDFGELSVGR